MSNNTQCAKLTDLGSLLKHTRIANNVAPNMRDPMPSPMRWGDEGVDHFNLWEASVTELGKVLAPNSSIPFVHSLFGRFGNLEAFWHYIQSEERDDCIKNLSGPILKNFAEKLTKVRVNNFRAIIMDSHWQRVKQYTVIVDAIRESTLPFDCYYINTAIKLRQRPILARWFIAGFEEIRKAIKENREPDFSFLLDRKDSGIYDFVIPKVIESSQPAIKTITPVKAALFQRVAEQVAAMTPVSKQVIEQSPIEETIAPEPILELSAA